MPPVEVYEVPVSVPSWIVPPAIITAPTVWLVVPRSTVPALTVSAPDVAPSVPLPLIRSVPPLIVVAPVYVLAPESVSTPEPIWSVFPLPCQLRCRPRCFRPPKVRESPLPVIVPVLLSVRVPLSELMRTPELPSAINPDQVLLPELLSKAPALETPVPFSVSGAEL